MKAVVQRGSSRRPVVAGVSLPLISPAGAVTRGGTMTYGRYADSLFLDPVLNDANVDIWILSNLYDTLLLPTDDGKGVQPGLATAWQVAARRQERHADAARRHQVLGRLAHHGRGREMVARPRPRPQGGHLELHRSSRSARSTIKDPKTVVLTLKHPDPAILAAPQRLQHRASCRRSSSRPRRARRATTRPRPSPNIPSARGRSCSQSWSRGAGDEARHATRITGAQGADGKPLPYLDGVTFEVMPDDATRASSRCSRANSTAPNSSPSPRRGAEGRSQARHGAVPLHQGRPTATSTSGPSSRTARTIRWPTPRSARR